MPTYKLVYFDMQGGRGETARLAFILGNLEFQDERIAGSDWPAYKPGTPFGQLPVLEVDGRKLTQTNTILRYIGKLTDQYPADPWEAAVCDEVMDAIEDFTGKVGATIHLEPEEKKKQREALAAEPLPRYLTQLQERLKGPYFAGDKLSVADLRSFLLVRFLKSGKLDHIPTDIVDKVAPRLVEHCERIQALPKVAAHFQAAV